MIGKLTPYKTDPALSQMIKSPSCTNQTNIIFGHFENGELGRGWAPNANSIKFTLSLGALYFIAFLISFLKSLSDCF